MSGGKKGKHGLRVFGKYTELGGRWPIALDSKMISLLFLSDRMVAKYSIITINSSRLFRSLFLH